MTENNPQPAVLRAITAGSDCYGAVDAALGAGLPPHAHSCALMIRGELAGLIRRLSYIASLVDVPEKAIQQVRAEHDDTIRAAAREKNDEGNAGAGESR